MGFKQTLERSLTFVSVKSEVLVETARTRSAIAAARRKRVTALTDLGARYFAARKQGAEEEETLAAACAAIDALDTEIAQLEARLEQIRREEQQLLGKYQQAPRPAEAIACAACGTALPKDAKFCSGCGSPVAEAAPKNPIEEEET